MTSANWKFSSGQESQCILTQKIPDYGKAVFTGKAGNVQDMIFSLTVVRNQPTTSGTATIKSVAPVWRQGDAAHELGQTSVSPGVTPITIKSSVAWRLLTELEQGMSPSFDYRGWIDGRDQVVVNLSPVNFFPVYEKFTNCIAGLPSPAPEETANSVINFQSGKYTFTEKARSRLTRISTHLRENDEQGAILIQGHTDSQGTDSYNDTLSRNRAEAVKRFLVQSGINKARIQTRSYGEREPIASNITDEGRLENRRVIIKVSQTDL